MDKPALVQFHQLLVLMKRDIEDRSGVTFEETLDRYEYAELDVQPNGIHQTVPEQEKAVLALASDFERAVQHPEFEATADEQELVQGAKLEAEKAETEEEADEPIQFTDY